MEIEWSDHIALTDLSYPLGPLLFILYTADLIDIMVFTIICTPTKQIQGSCRPDSVHLLQSTLSDSLDEVSDLMRSNRLQLNTEDRNTLVFDIPSASSAANYCYQDRC